MEKDAGRISPRRRPFKRYGFLIAMEFSSPIRSKKKKQLFSFSFVRIFFPGKLQIRGNGFIFSQRIEPQGKQKKNSRRKK